MRVDKSKKYLQYKFICRWRYRCT